MERRKRVVRLWSWGVIAAVLASVAVLGCAPEEDNLYPVIASLLAFPPAVNPGGTSTVTCDAKDPEEQPLTYAWSERETQRAGRLISGSGASVTWTAPEQTGLYTVQVRVGDPKGATATATVVIGVGDVTHNPALVGRWRVVSPDYDEDWVFDRDDLLVLKADGTYDFFSDEGFSASGAWATSGWLLTLENLDNVYHNVSEAFLTLAHEPASVDICVLAPD